MSGTDSGTQTRTSEVVGGCDFPPALRRTNRSLSHRLTILSVMYCEECGQMFLHDDDIVTVPEYVYDRPVEFVGRRRQLPGLVKVHPQCARNHPHRFAEYVPGAGRLIDES